MVAEWAAMEAATAELGDARLNRRMAKVLSDLGERPNLSIPAASAGHAEMHAAYRFFDNDKVCFDSVLAPHLEQSLQRVAREKNKKVLLVQDTTEVDLSRPGSEVKGAGDLGRSRKGTVLHVMHAFSQEGTPLGTVWAQAVNRPESAAGKPGRKQLPIEEKESFRWLQCLRKAREIAADLPQVRCVCVTDSEGDIFELLSEPRALETPDARSPSHPVDWLIRSCYDRVVEARGKQGQGQTRHLRERVLATPVMYQTEIHVRGRTPKYQSVRSKRRQAREGRKALVEVRCATVCLQPPYRRDRRLPAVQVNVVLVSEVGTPAGEVPIEWLLLTTLPTDTLEQVREVVECYCLRWNIEIIFRTLKGGCRIEQRRFEHIDRVLPALALYLIVAWRTLLVCRQGRETPDVSCEVLFTPSEWKSVWMSVKGKKPPRRPPKLREVVHLIAQLGGYVERKGSEPGPQTVWIGLQRMHDLSLGWDAFGPGASQSQ